MLDFLNNPELEKQCEEAWADTLNWIDIKSQYQQRAFSGGPQAAIEYFYLCAKKDVKDKGAFYCKDYYTYLEYAAKKGDTQALKLIVVLYATGGVPGIGECNNISPMPETALEFCDYFTEEALQQDDVKELVQRLKNQVNEENEKAKNASEGCYIATAVYGNYDAPEVLVLRNFRDSVLLKSFWGRIFVKIYYFMSPPLANRLKNYDWLNNKVKSILDKFVHFLKHNS